MLIFKKVNSPTVLRSEKSFGKRDAIMFNTNFKDIFIENEVMSWNSALFIGSVQFQISLEPFQGLVLLFLFVHSLKLISRITKCGYFFNFGGQNHKPHNPVCEFRNKKKVYRCYWLKFITIECHTPYDGKLNRFSAWWCLTRYLYLIQKNNENFYKYKVF